jgi:hypothetical protein
LPNNLLCHFKVLIKAETSQNKKEKIFQTNFNEASKQTRVSNNHGILFVFKETALKLCNRTDNVNDKRLYDRFCFSSLQLPRDFIVPIFVTHLFRFSCFKHFMLTLLCCNFLEKFKKFEFAFKQKKKL